MPSRPVPTLLAGLIALATAGLAAAQPALAQSPSEAAPDQRLDAVKVEADADDELTEVEQRQVDTATRSIYGRETLEAYGDDPVTDVLRRLPGVSLAPGGGPRLRGLGSGYTQILINGQPAPRFLGLSDLTADQVSRIEVIRGAVAEYSTQSIAGTINIVLDESQRPRQDKLISSLAVENGEITLGAVVQKQLSPSLGDLRLGVRKTDSLASTETSTQITDAGLPRLDQRLVEETDARRDSVFLSGQIRPLQTPGLRISLQPFILDTQRVAETDGQYSVTAGQPPANQLRSQSRSDVQVARLQANVNAKLGFGDLEVKGSIRLGESDTTTRRQQLDAAGGLLSQRVSGQDSSSQSIGLSPKLTRQLSDGKRLVTGFQIDLDESNTFSRELEDGGNPLATTGQRFEGSKQLLAGFGQLEWDPVPAFGISLGLRWEQLRLKSTTDQVNTQQTSTVLSPLLNAVWRLDPAGSRQVRLGLSRTYKAPSLTDLNPIPSLSAEFPTTGTNTAVSPDSVGNPLLRPEKSWGLDLSFEQTLSRNSLLSASLFARQIDDVILRSVALESVAWSGSPRYVVRPRNFGEAETYGIELEARLKSEPSSKGLLRLLPAGLETRASLVRQESRIRDLAGDDAHLDEQPEWTASLGADYTTRLAGERIRTGFQASFQPAQALRRSEFETLRTAGERQLEAYLEWKPSSRQTLRLTVLNLTPNDTPTLKTVGDGSLVFNEQRLSRSYTAVRILYTQSF